MLFSGTLSIALLVGFLVVFFSGFILSNVRHSKRNDEIQKEKDEINREKEDITIRKSELNCLESNISNREATLKHEKMLILQERNSINQEKISVERERLITQERIIKQNDSIRRRESVISKQNDSIRQRESVISKEESAFSARLYEFEKTVELGTERIERNERIMLRGAFNLGKELKISLLELGNLADKTNQVDKLIDENCVRAKKYIDRLNNLNAERREAFNARPKLTTISSLVEEKTQFSQTREEFWLREQALCESVAQSKRLSIPFSTTATPCQIIRVIDGDTVDVMVNDALLRIRLMGYDTPEVCNPSKPGYEHWGIQSSEAVQRIVEKGSKFTIRLDKVGKEKSWNSDRYGRILAHIEVDGVLLGLKVIKYGDGEVVDGFPIEEDILQLYKKAEHEAKINDLGMWSDINRYKLEKKQSHKKRKWNLQTLIENRNDRNMTQQLLKDVLRDMLGSILLKSRDSVVLHKEGCHHVNRIKFVRSIEFTEDWLEANANSIRPCKICGGDDLIREIIG